MKPDDKASSDEPATLTEADISSERVSRRARLTSDTRENAMTRIILSTVAIAAVLAASPGLPAGAREPILPKKPKEIVVVGSSASKPQPKTLSAQQRRQRLYPEPTCPQCTIKKNSLGSKANKQQPKTRTGNQRRQQKAGPPPPEIGFGTPIGGGM